MGLTGQCEGNIYCSQFPCPSNLPCAWLNTSFSITLCLLLKEN